MKGSARKTAKSSQLESSNNPHADEEVLSGKDIMQAVLSRPSQAGKSREMDNPATDGIVIGTFSGLGEAGQPLVTFDGAGEDKPLVALSAVRLEDFDSGKQVALSFIHGDLQRPMILGLIHQPGSAKRDRKVEKLSDPELDVALDGERLTLTANREIVLKCGKASITLTSAGKIIIKGAYLSNTSTGLNRIRGGSVQIN
jgi:hypothetical protein